MKYWWIVLMIFCLALMACVQASPRPVVARAPTPYPIGISVEFDRNSVQPKIPTEVVPGKKIFLGICFKNTGENKRVFWGAVSLHRAGDESYDNDINLRPLIPIELAPGEEAEVLWEYTPEEAGCWDLFFGVWGIWAPEMEPDFPIGYTVFRQYLCATR